MVTGIKKFLKVFRAVTALSNSKKVKIMKTIFYILIALCMTTSFTACTTDSIADAVEPSTEEVATNGDGHVADEDEG
ncbi:hypothetical protein GCM10022258_13530 [Aquimarina gracilis]